MDILGKLSHVLIWCLSLYLISVAGHGVTQKHSKSKRIIIVSFDGFRWDYLSLLPSTNNFTKLIQGGAHAPEGIRNIFITKTFPNHYSLVTGLYEETHGIVGNSMYDPDYSRVISLLQTSSEHLSRLFLGEPIWVSHILQNKADKVACIMWPGCVFKIKGIKLNRTMHYDQSVSWKERVDMGLRYMTADDVELLLLYYHEPDSTGHGFGPDSEEMKVTVSTVNDYVGYLIKQLKFFNLFENVDLIITSDHGMSTIGNVSFVPVKSDLFEVVVKFDTLWHIRPRKTDGAVETVKYLKERIKHAKVWKKEDLPEVWHYSNSDRILPVILVADEGWVLKEVGEDHSHGGGTHGYDNRNHHMWPVFVAHGPSFKSGESIEKNFTSLDVYNTMCLILGLKPAHNNGSLERASSFLQDHLASVAIQLMGSSSANSWASVSVTILVVLGSCVGAVVFVFIFVLAYRSSNRRQIRYSMRLGSPAAITRAGYVLASDNAGSDSDFESSESEELFSSVRPPLDTKQLYNGRGAGGGV